MICSLRILPNSETEFCLNGSIFKSNNLNSFGKESLAAALSVTIEFLLLCERPVSAKCRKPIAM
jgi:hypothetical protein